MESGSLHQETFRLKLGRDGVLPQKGRDCICTNRLELRPMIGPLEERKITALNILPIDFSRHIFWRYKRVNKLWNPYTKLQVTAT